MSRKMAIAMLTMMDSAEFMPHIGLTIEGLTRK
jgi:hypothetical protein